MAFERHGSDHSYTSAEQPLHVAFLPRMDCVIGGDLLFSCHGYPLSSLPCLLELAEPEQDVLTIESRSFADSARSATSCANTLPSRAVVNALTSARTRIRTRMVCRRPKALIWAAPCCPLTFKECRSPRLNPTRSSRSHCLR